ncbi:hypothetical protein FIBSPDRAFT_990213, partial [Athelia psychrophila]
KDAYEDVKHHQSNCKVNHTEIRVLEDAGWVNPNLMERKAGDARARCARGHRGQWICCPTRARSGRRRRVDRAPPLLGRRAHAPALAEDALGGRARGRLRQGARQRVVPRGYPHLRD